MPNIKKRPVDLKSVASRNTQVSKKVGREAPEVVKSGVPLDHSIKHDIPEVSGPSKRVGCNIGCTLNMDNYESVRIDCWLTDEVQPGETFEEAFSRILLIANNQVEEVAQTYRSM